MSDSYPMYIDRRDEEVVKRMEIGGVYGATHVKNSYKRYTDIRQDSTAKNRKDNLFNSPCMEFSGRIGFFEFVGFDNE